MSGGLIWFIIWVINGLCITLAHYSKNPVYKTDVPLIISRLCMLSALFVPENEVDFRGALALASLFYHIKTREVLLESRFAVEPLWIKIVSVIGTFHDVQERKPCEPWIIGRLKQIAGTAFLIGLHFLGYFLSLQAFKSRHELANLVFSSDPLLQEYLRTAIACVSACLLAFYSLHLYGDSLDIVWVTVGFKFPGLMNSPEQALSVKDFWKRWDTVIQKILEKYVFTPVRAAGYSSKFAISMTFFASGLVHILPIIVARGSDWVAAASMMSYFVVQLSVMILERNLGVDSWNPWVARIWTIINLFGPSYLLVFPCLRLFDIEF